MSADLAITFRPLADRVHASLVQERIVAGLSGFFGGLALLLAGLGLYGVTAYGVARRLAEMGIRLALGASPRGVAALVLRRVALLVGLGVAGGTAASLWALRFVSALLYGLEPHDPATIAGAIGILATVATLAAWLPARAHPNRPDARAQGVVKARSVVASFTVVPFRRRLSEICIQNSDSEAGCNLNALAATALAVRSCVLVCRHAAVMR